VDLGLDVDVDVGAGAGASVEGKIRSTINMSGGESIGPVPLPVQSLSSPSDVGPTSSSLRTGNRHSIARRRNSEMFTDPYRSGSTTPCPSPAQQDRVQGVSRASSSSSVGRLTINAHKEKDRKHTLARGVTLHTQTSVGDQTRRSSADSSSSIIARHRHLSSPFAERGTTASSATSSSAASSRPTSGSSWCDHLSTHAHPTPPLTPPPNLPLPVPPPSSSSGGASILRDPRRRSHRTRVRSEGKGKGKEVDQDENEGRRSVLAEEKGSDRRMSSEKAASSSEEKDGAQRNSETSSTLREIRGELLSKQLLTGFPLPPARGPPPGSPQAVRTIDVDEDRAGTAQGGTAKPPSTRAGGSSVEQTPQKGSPFQPGENDMVVVATPSSGRSSFEERPSSPTLRSLVASTQRPRHTVRRPPLAIELQSDESDLGEWRPRLDPQ
jgi:hypothetical protein